MIPARHPPAILSWGVWGLGGLLYLVAFYQRVAPAVITDKLMTEFAIGAAALGNLSAFYFYSYVAMQIPTGIIADRWGPRRLLTAGAAIAAVGTALFAAAPSLWWANAGRLLIGASVAVAFVSMLKLASHWFAPRQFPLVSGMALFVGIVGAVFAGRPLRAVVESFGWREVMAASAALTAVLAAVIWLRVRDDPADAGYASHFSGSHDGAQHTAVLRGLAEILSYRNTWLLFLTPGGMAGAVLTFAGLWGVPYLVQVNGMARSEAAGFTTAMLLGFAVGGPLLGALSDRIGRRKMPYLGAALVHTLGWGGFLLAPDLSHAARYLLFAVIGFSAGGLIVGFAFSREVNHPGAAGTVGGVVNMAVLGFAAIQQSAMGWILDRNWQGALVDGARIYDAAAYHAAFLWLAISALGAVVSVALTRETYCRLRFDADTP